MSNSRKTDNARRLRNKLWAIKYCGGQCNMCKVKYPHYVYEFHHLTPRRHRRKGTISSVLERPRKTIRKALEGCILLCANCHKIIHNEGEI